ncbi:hypothetical protein D7Z54_32330 [Salibacterium salarium]|uniref:Uncharacterized protein n=1 Tax=Salibacterium salarium TaxID=284579 RepID=A0A3R9PET2_9BACI|nr:hypothetical protein [Salibacterium salarium]RSL29227.1 hypothetical protein D7Z54_32330 [Salibacterium salarium]
MSRQQLESDRQFLEDMRGQIDEELFREKYGVTPEQAESIAEYVWSSTSIFGDSLRRFKSKTHENQREVESEIRRVNSRLKDVEENARESAITGNLAAILSTVAIFAVIGVIIFH